MRAQHAAARLVPWLPCHSHDALTTAAFALAQNLAFDARLRAEMVAHGLVSKLVALLQPTNGTRAAAAMAAAAAASPFRLPALRLLYQLSTDAERRAVLAAPEAGLVPVVKELVLGWPRSILGEELAALAVNLSWEAQGAEALCHKAGLRRLVDRLLRHRDPLVAKIVRSVSHWSLGVQAGLADPDAEYDLRSLWPSHVKPLVGLALERGVAPRLLVEVLGTLGNLTPLDLPIGTTWRDVLAAHPLLVGACARWVSTGEEGGGEAEAEAVDVVLEAVMVLQALALDGSVAGELARAGVVR
jgi:hypothetical protein